MNVRVGSPWGWWDTRGRWHPNLAITMTPDEQRRANEANGYDCSGGDELSPFASPLPKHERRRIGQEMPRCACGKARAHDKEKCGICEQEAQMEARMAEASRAWEERERRFRDQQQRHLDELKADIMTAATLEELRDVILRVLNRQESKR